MTASSHEPQFDAVTGKSTTGHEWDGIQELNTPLPKWWLYVLYATVVWAIGYYVFYPSWPGASDYLHGALGWSARGTVVEDVAAGIKGRAEFDTLIANTALADIEKDPKLLAFARAQGKAAFGLNCAPCHGTGAQGSKGFPNLNDDDWLWGGTLDQIYTTIGHGIRSDDPDAHTGNMPSFGKDGTLKKEEIVQVADYVRSLSGLEKGDVSAGKKIFADNCAACHGDDAKGNQDLGSANLTDQIWLYGGDKATVIETITNGRGGVMPAWGKKLPETTVKALAVYVHTLGGGK
jgi:cytochrome c oxidase cbb3-type subunit 3